MLTKRIIPCLDIKNGKVVKGVNFIGLKDVGDPIELAKRYDQQCSDEVVFLDITASYEQRDIIKDLIERGAKELSIPLAVGGGIRTIDDFRMILASGADKVSVNSAAIANPDLIKEAADEFGVQCVVVAIDAKKRASGGYDVYVKGGRENTGIDLIEWVKKCQELGAGEILLTSMDADGTKAGYDIDMINAVCDVVDIPVIASGGCGSIQDIVDVFKKTNCDAALVASLFHFGEATVEQVRQELRKEGINVRRAI
ncbi:MAG TPA: imidazole glycerol phosphate synthase subunit HisF [Candidatus Erysipelatoclostridium merdavium]|uniref:Imidazole glycerol phosphate synthase subunit HisF n=1 Tax=Candidatus Erysipelatoclostridium merdavium TaxID=2838566 RepID=A0A9D1XPH7_9FIRM|nr:imidazole glycerol phosphate synthase subunit HisF [Candidatus Erysipelatoclostridium merdavium]